VSSLGRGEASAWLDLTYQAAKAELLGASTPRASEDELRAALRALRERFADADAERLLTVLAQLRAAAPADACWAGRAVYAQVPRLGAPHDRVLARVLAAP
jgi:hypothetical protein